MQLPEPFGTGKLFVVGMGGGCDIITAYVVSRHLPGLSPHSIVGNTKRHAEGLVRPKAALMVPMTSEAERNTTAETATKTAGVASNPPAPEPRRVMGTLGGVRHLWQLPQHVPLEAEKNYYGTTGLDAGVPFTNPPLVVTAEEVSRSEHTKHGESGGVRFVADKDNATTPAQEELRGATGYGPWIVQIPKPPNRHDRVDESILVDIGRELGSLGFDGFVGVDAGGDSLTGGIDHSGDPSTGVDQMMSRILCYTGKPVLHVVCGLGSDGESTVEQLEQTLKDNAPFAVPGSPILMRGWDFYSISRVLTPDRTPNVMSRAIASYLDDEQMTEQKNLQLPRRKNDGLDYGASGESRNRSDSNIATTVSAAHAEKSGDSSPPASCTAGSPTSTPMMLVPRGLRPWIPVQWLASVFVFRRQ